MKSSAPKILIIEDEKKISALIRKGLEEDHYAVDEAFDGETGEQMLSRKMYHLVILDIMLPKKDGLEVLNAVRKSGNDLPVLMLTAKGTVEDRVKGLDTGADDYLVKPFAISELLARVRSLLRRKKESVNETLHRRSDARSGVAQSNKKRHGYRSNLQRIRVVGVFYPQQEQDTQPQRHHRTYLELQLRYRHQHY